MSDRDLSTDFNQIPESFDSQRNNVRSEIFRLVNNVEEISANSKLNDFNRNGLIIADSGQSLKHTDGSVDA